MDVKKITERDWEKYERMQKIAVSKHQLYLYALLCLGVILLFAIALFGTANSITQIPKLNAYAIPALSITNHTLLPLNVFNNSKTYNQTLASLISNPTRLSQTILYVGAISTLSLLFEIVMIMLALVFITVAILNALDADFFSPIRGKPTSYKHLRKRLENKERQKQKMTNRLLAANYTEKDIAWYFDMEESLTKYQWEI